MKINELKKMAVIGAGNMGHGIAQLALMNGIQVNLCDIKQEFVESGKTKIYESLDKLASKGKFDAAKVEEIKAGQLQIFTSIDEACKDVQFAMEVVPEIENIKLSTLEAIGKALPENAILGTNTSTMDITTLAAATGMDDRFVGMHYFFPPVLMKLVEVIKGEKTSDETLQFAKDYCEMIGKVIVVAMKSRPGFIANRIEAPNIVYNGLQLDVDKRDPNDIDIAMTRDGGLKMGPMELADYSGIDVMAACQDYYHAHLSEEYGASKTMQALLDEKHYGKKTGSGFYVWPEKGRPVYDESKFTGTYNPDIPHMIRANEASKLVEEGVCSYEDCDKAMIYGYNMPGPIEYIQKFEPAEIAKILQDISDKYGYKIFAPTESIKNGSYKK